VPGYCVFLWLSALSREVSGFVTVIARAGLLAVVGLSLAVVFSRGVATWFTALNVVEVHRF
jgi:hypothetical protein